MHYVLTFILGAAVGGAGVGYVAYNYGKKVVAVVSAAKQS